MVARCQKMLEMERLLGMVDMVRTPCNVQPPHPV